MIVKQGRIEKFIYEVKNLGEQEIIKEYLYREPQFITLDERERHANSGIKLSKNEFICLVG